MLLQVALLFEDGIAGHIRHPANNHPTWFAADVCINCRDASCDTHCHIPFLPGVSLSGGDWKLLLPD
ncbi:MAG: hypothetical protein ACYS32_01580 [Planctomycetota bacterium]